MTVHCPECGKRNDSRARPDDEVRCERCGHGFRVSTKETVPLAGPVPESGKETTPLPDPDRAPGRGDSSSRRSSTSGPRAEVGGQLGDYLLERELGRGGMGQVFLATQRSLRQKVALKVLSQDLSEDDSFVRRFDQEAHSLAKLKHPNVVRILGTTRTRAALALFAEPDAPAALSILEQAEEGGAYFFAMEYVEGRSLRDALEGGPLAPVEALRIVGQVLDALDYAHGEGVIHRDIKPENILLDRSGQAKIADFGLARLLRGDGTGDRITRTRMVMGTRDYMAPEQRERSRDVDHRADLYSLGVVLYEMLTGELPIGSFPPPSELNPQVDARIDAIVDRVLQKDPKRRYKRASEVSSAIEEARRQSDADSKAGVRRSRRSPPQDDDEAAAVGALRWVVAALILLAGGAGAFAGFWSKGETTTFFIIVGLLVVIDILILTRK